MRSRARRPVPLPRPPAPPSPPRPEPFRGSHRGPPAAPRPAPLLRARLRPGPAAPQVPPGPAGGAPRPRRAAAARLPGPGGAVAGGDEGRGGFSCSPEPVAGSRAQAAHEPSTWHSSRARGAPRGRMAGKGGEGGWPARSPFRGGAPPAERGWGQPAWPPGCGMLSARRLPGQSRKVVAPSPPRRVNNVAAAEPGGPPPALRPFPGPLPPRPVPPLHSLPPLRAAAGSIGEERSLLRDTSPLPG